MNKRVFIHQTHCRTDGGSEHDGIVALDHWCSVLMCPAAWVCPVLRYHWCASSNLSCHAYHRDERNVNRTTTSVFHCHAIAHGNAMLLGELYVSFHLYKESTPFAFNFWRSTLGVFPRCLPSATGLPLSMPTCIVWL